MMNVFNIVTYLFWVFIVIALLFVQESFTRFEWLVLIFLCVFGIMFADSKLWSEKENKK